MPVAPPPPALVEGLTDLCAALVKAQQDFRRYPRNNPLLARRLEDLLQRLAQLFTTTAAVRLEVGPTTLTYEGQEVYRGPERGSLTAPLHRHGIRELSLHRGVSREEVEALLDALNYFPNEEDPDEDLLTFLWEKHLRGVRYVVVDDVPGQARWATDPLGMLSDILSAQPERPLAEALPELLREARSAPAHDPRASLQAVRLGEPQRASLQAMREADRQQDVAVAVIDVLLSVLRSGVGSRDLEELLRAVGRIVAASLADGQLQRATRVLRQLRQVVAVEEDPAVAQAVRATLDGVGSAQVLAPLFERIQAGWEGVDEEALGALLHALPVSAAPALAGALEQLADRRMRRLFCTVIAGLVRDDVERLAPLMVADSWYVTRNLAYILGLTHNPASQRILRELAGHPHERVRLEALRSLSQFRGATTRSLVLRALDDPDRGVRMQALGVVTGYPDPATTRALLTRLADRGFSRLDAQEKRALAVATGRLARDAALPELTALLQQRSLLGRARSEEERAAAVHGLAAVGSPAAQAQLAQLAQESAGARALVEQALREAHAPPPPPEGA
jgi:hypothetical protein